jgi:hypothetical protein
MSSTFFFKLNYILSILFLLWGIFIACPWTSHYPKIGDIPTKEVFVLFGTLWMSYWFRHMADCETKRHLKELEPK